MDLTEYCNDEFNSWAEWFAARYELRGSKALKATLAELIGTEDCYRELFWEPAAELMVQGLSRPAIMVRNASLKWASLTDLDAFWPYSWGRMDPVAVRAAIASTQRKLKDYRQKAELLLRQAGLGLEWLGEDDSELIQSAEETKAEDN